LPIKKEQEGNELKGKVHSLEAVVERKKEEGVYKE